MRGCRSLRRVNLSELLSGYTNSGFAIEKDLDPTFIIVLKRKKRTVEGPLVCCFHCAYDRSYGGEGEIRTPGSLSTTSDFESGAFNRALPPLRVLTTQSRSG